MKNYNIAIDGPAGAGKSTIAKAVSKKLNFIYIDTGAMYRAVGLYYLNKNVDLENEFEINGLLDDIKIDLTYIDGVQQIILNGENVSNLIRNEEVSSAASVVSTYKKVREKMVSIQQELARVNNVVMDGRDIGTVVLPNADLKIYLTASSEERAKRRYKELLEKGEEVDLETIKKDIEERDYRDMNRENSPLKQADDAILLDSSNMTIDEVIDYILNLCNKN